MSWLQEVFAIDKPVIGMAHFPALPGTPRYDERGGMAHLYESIAADVQALQAGGVHGILFCNEDDRPYVWQVGPEVPAAMARVIAEVRPQLKVPFGVDVLWDPRAAIAIAHATGAQFVREVFTGAYSSDMGVWDTRAGEAQRYRRQIGAQNVRLLYNINAEFAAPLAPRPLEQVARSVALSSLPDAICVSGAMTGSATDPEALRSIKQAVLDVPVIVNTGVRAETVAQFLAVADAAIVGTSIKQGGVTWNPVDRARVVQLMEEAAKWRHCS